MPPRNPKGKRSPAVTTRARLDALRALAGDPDAQASLAVTYVEESKDLDVLRPALDMLRAQADPGLRPVLHAKYAWCEQAPERHDSGGFIRAAIIRALQPIINDDDLPLLRGALLAYGWVGMYEVCAEVRATALNALADLDPDLSTFYAARFLRDPHNSNSGEPALSAVRLLAAQGQLAPLFGYAAFPPTSGETPAWLQGTSEITAEALRNLANLPASLVPLLIKEYVKSEDEQILLGLYDLLLAHPARAQWRGVIEHFLTTTRHMDLYALVVTQIVVTRDETLIAMLREMAAGAPDRIRHELLQHALEHA